MSWDQEYNIPPIESLLEKLTGFSSLELLKEELACQGILITKEEDILLDSDVYQEIKGTKVTLSDGRVFVPKLVEQFTEDGNHGIDTYKYVLESETPKVQHIDGDTSNSDVDVFTLSKEDKQDYIETTENSSFKCGDCENCPKCEFGLTDEYPPEFDGDIDSPIDEAME